MRVPMRWLRTYCDPPLDTTAVANALNDAGIELGRVDRVGVGSHEAFVVGRVLTAERHPNADRLRVCTVDDGSAEARTIVCGAPNVAAGQTVAVARPGALMPNGERLGEAELRGVRSSGMILAEDELGVGPDHTGVVVLGSDIAPGTPLVEVIPIQDEVLDLEISPNRPDCLGVYGVAREVHALTGAPLVEDPTAADAEPAGDARAEDLARVEVDPEICLRFTARVFTDVKVGPSPAWLKARLSAAGQRPISNVVDITNYVMLVTGQPLHAFDLDELRDARVVARRARQGERLVTLDGVERVLDQDLAVVADAERAVGIAGIMGGSDSEVSETTTRVLMEAATWVGPNILRSSSKLGLRSEASTRFEKQLHPDGALAAQRLAARLMVELCGARMAEGTLDVYPAPVEPHTVALRPARVERLLGARIERGEIERILARLGFRVAAEAHESLPERLAEVGDALLERLADAGVAGAGELASHPLGQALQRVAAEAGDLRSHPLGQALQRIVGEADAALAVSVPSFRAGDVRREADLIEEVARIHGLERLPTTLPPRRRAVGRLTPAQQLRRRLEDALRDRGVAEVIAYSFTAPATLARLRLDDAAGVPIANPLSEEHSVMRPLLIPGLLDAAAHNAAHGRPAVALFESAHVCRRILTTDARSDRSPQGATPADERHHIGAVLTRAAPPGWRSPERPADFFAAKALVEALLAIARVDFGVEPAQLPFLHPSRQATVLAGSGPIGWVGELHPAVAEEWDLGTVACLELDFDALAALAPATPIYRALSSYPPVVQDIAVVVPEDVGYGDILSVVRDAAGETLETVVLFDVYRGEQIDAGHKSLALRLEFRAADRTLTDAEVATVRAAIERAIVAKGGRLRA